MLDSFPPAQLAGASLFIYGLRPIASIRSVCYCALVIFKRYEQLPGAHVQPPRYVPADLEHRTSPVEENE